MRKACTGYDGFLKRPAKWLCQKTGLDCVQDSDEEAKDRRISQSTRASQVDALVDYKYSHLRNPVSPLVMVRWKTC